MAHQPAQHTEHKTYISVLVNCVHAMCAMWPKIFTKINANGFPKQTWQSSDQFSVLRTYVPLEAGGTPRAEDWVPDSDPEESFDMGTLRGLLAASAQLSTTKHIHTHTMTSGQLQPPTISEKENESLRCYWGNLSCSKHANVYQTQSKLIGFMAEHTHTHAHTPV